MCVIYYCNLFSGLVSCTNLLTQNHVSFVENDALSFQMYYYTGAFQSWGFPFTCE